MHGSADPDPHQNVMVLQHYLMGGEQERVWKDVRCGELTGPGAAAAAVQELWVGQGGSRQARQRFRLLHHKRQKKIITGKTTWHLKLWG